VSCVEIDSVSARFCTIYNQSRAAEDHGLLEIAGVGYRKSLEVLVKDFCVALRPADSATIKKSSSKKFLINTSLKGGSKRLPLSLRGLGTMRPTMSAGGSRKIFKI